MQISLSSVLVGLVTGAAIGFMAAGILQKQSDDNAVADQLGPASSLSAPGNSKANTIDNVVARDASSTFIDNASSPVIDSLSTGQSVNINADQLINRNQYAQGFTAELTIMNQVAQADFDELQNLAVDLLQEPQAHLVSRGLQLIGMRMVELDPSRSMDFLFNHVSSPEATRSVYEVHAMVTALAGTHHNELLSWADNLPDKQAAHTIRTQVLAGLARVNPEEALSVYSQHSTGQFDENLYSLLQGWSDVDPQSAMLWSLDQPGAGHDMHPTEIVFSQWVISDYAAAEAFLNTVDDESIKSRLALSLINEMSYRDPQSAIELAMGMEDSQSRSQAFETAFYGWSSHSLMDAIDFATNSLSGEDQERAFYIIGMTAGNSRPGQFGGNAYDTMVMTETMPDALGEMVRMSNMYNFFMEDSQAALQWLDTVSDPIEREQLLSTVAYDMAQTDLVLAQSMFDQSSESIQMMLGDGIAIEMYNNSPESAWSWYDQLPDGQVKTSVLYGLVHNEAQTNPDKAIQLAMDHQQGHQGAGGDDMLFSVFATAAGSNQQWASDWLDQANLSPDMSKQLRMILQDFRFNGYDRFGH